MTTLHNLPGHLDIEIGLGDDLKSLFDFDFDMTGYTFVCKVIKIPEGTETAVTVTITSLSLGQIIPNFTSTIVTALGIGIHKWYLDGTVSGNNRRLFAGDFIVKEKQ